MAASKFSLSLILAFLAVAVTLVTGSPLSRRQTGTCIVPLIIFTSFNEPFSLTVQNKTHPEVHNLPVSYVSENANPGGPVEHFLALGKYGDSTISKFRLTDQRLYPAPEVGIPEQIPAYTRDSKFKDLVEIYFPAALPPQVPTTLWNGFYGCSEDTGTGQLELGAGGFAGLCAKKDGKGGYRLFLKTVGMCPTEREYVGDERWLTGLW